ncbi:MAG: type II toxin-antitoxin system HicB family antitoxin [Chitinophagaceae bacterium]
MTRYLVVYERTNTGYSAYVPDLPGCIATASTKKSIEKNIYESILYHLDGLKDEGLAIPQSKSESEVLVFA